MKRLTFLVLLCSLFSGCGVSSPSSPNRRAKESAAKAALLSAQKSTPEVKPEEDVASDLSFRFAGLNNLNKKCSTGLRAFASRQLLCINIQDPAQNNECALEKRVSKFTRDCSPEFSWNESVSCHFALLDRAAEVAANGEYPAKFERMAGDLCAGRTSGGADEAGVSGKMKPLLDDLLSDVEIQFVPASTPGRIRTHFRMSIYRNDSSGVKTPLVGDFQFASGFKVSSGNLGDSKFKYVIRCENVWACPAKK